MTKSNEDRLGEAFAIYDEMEEMKRVLQVTPTSKLKLEAARRLQVLSTRFEALRPTAAHDSKGEVSDAEDADFLPMHWNDYLAENDGQKYAGDFELFDIVMGYAMDAIGNARTGNVAARKEKNDE